MNNTVHLTWQRYSKFYQAYTGYFTAKSGDASFNDFLQLRYRNAAVLGRDPDGFTAKFDSQEDMVDFELRYADIGR